MARIRTIKPEFWTDDLIGSLSLETRLLFIGTWNLADDEGLLRWSAPYLKGAIFPFDDAVTVKHVERSMQAIVAANLAFPYLGGRSQQALACVVNFHKHQRINRPSPSKLPPPSLQMREVAEMYANRDGYICHLCGGPVDKIATAHSMGFNDDFTISLDHVHPVSFGGTDYPSNIRLAHQTCNKGRGNRTVEQYKELLLAGKTAAQFRHPERFTHLVTTNSVSEAVTGTATGSIQEGEGEKERGKGSRNEDEKIVVAVATPPATVPALVLAPEPDITELPSNLQRGEIGEAIQDWNAMAERVGLSAVRQVTEARRRALKARLVEAGGLEGWRAAMAKVEASPFLRGERSGNGHDRWRATFDFVVTQGNFTKLMEGNYDDRQAAATAASRREILESVGLAPGLEDDGPGAGGDHAEPPRLAG